MIRHATEYARFIVFAVALLTTEAISTAALAAGYIQSDPYYQQAVAACPSSGALAGYKVSRETCECVVNAVATESKAFAPLTLDILAGIFRGDDIEFTPTEIRHPVVEAFGRHPQLSGLISFEGARKMIAAGLNDAAIQCEEPPPADPRAGNRRAPVTQMPRHSNSSSTSVQRQDMPVPTRTFSGPWVGAAACGKDEVKWLVIQIGAIPPVGPAHVLIERYSSPEDQAPAARFEALAALTADGRSLRVSAKEGSGNAEDQPFLVDLKPDPRSERQLVGNFLAQPECGIFGLRHGTLADLRTDAPSQITAEEVDTAVRAAVRKHALEHLEKEMPNFYAVLQESQVDDCLIEIVRQSVDKACRADAEITKQILSGALDSALGWASDVRTFLKSHPDRIDDTLTMSEIVVANDWTLDKAYMDFFRSSKPPTKAFADCNVVKMVAGAGAISTLKYYVSKARTERRCPILVPAR